MYDRRDLVCRYTAVPYASTLRHVNLCNINQRPVHYISTMRGTPHDNIARILVSADMRSHENQRPLREAFIELLERPAQLCFFLIPVGVIL